MTRTFCCVLFATAWTWTLPADSRAGIKAGAAQRDITPPVGYEIQHSFRKSIGVRDPLYARCLYLEDGRGNSVAIVCTDLIMGSFDACDRLRAEILKKTGVENSLIAFSHSHSSAALGPRGRPASASDKGSKWNDATLDAIVAIVHQAKDRAEPVSLRAGRAPAQVGFNRRLVNKKNGHVFMGVNRKGPVVPWVNVLAADSKKTGKPIAVLMEHAAHPVIVPHTSKLTSADYPGAAVKRIREELGEDVIALFGQGCGGNINGFPLRSTHEQAEKAGRNLGEAALAALKQSRPIQSEKLSVKFARAMLPSGPLPSEKLWREMAAKNKGNERRMKQLKRIRAVLDRGAKPPARRFDAYAVMLGQEWCLVTMPHEMFCQYELWIDKNAPFRHTMTFAYTNGYQGYVAVDEAWRLGPKGGYEAASLPNWGGQVWTEHFGPPAVGSEKIIKDTIQSLWPEEAKGIQPAKDAPQPLSPERSAAKMRLPKGFRIELVASEPLIQDPSCIAFDERGRLFVCELHGYNVEGHLDVVELNKTGVLDKKVRRLRWELMGGKIAQQARKLQRGVVKMLTDTDGDGVMDKAHVWADDLPPCYGVVPARGGVIVVAAPDIVFLADRDGDGKVDVRETLFTGFRITTLERGINNPRWGLDNWIYVGAGSHAGLIRGPHLRKPVNIGNQDFRIKPDGSAIEPVSGSVGTYGLALNDVGDRFPCSGGQPAVYALPLPHRYLTRNPFVPTPRTNHSAANYSRGFRISKPHPWRVRRQQDPAWVKFYGRRETDSNYFTGGCGGEIYRDEVFPKPYRGNFFYCEPSLNIVHRCILQRDGAGYKARRAPGEERSEFLASTDSWFRPINLRLGPDGGLYIVDMYREIIEDYSAIPRFLQQQYGVIKGNDRGRIWRLAPESAPKRKPVDMARLSTKQLAAATGDANAWRRHTAQRLLMERGDRSAAAALSEQARGGATPQGRIHAMYTLDGLGALRAPDVAHALGDSDNGVRVHALRLADHWLKTDGALIAQAAKMTGDADPRVRLQLAMTLGESSDPRASGALLEMARQHGNERWMAAAILSSARESAGALLVGLLREPSPSKKARALLAPLAATLGGRRDRPQMARVLRALAEQDAAVQAECLKGLHTGISRGSEPIPKSAVGWAPLKQLLRSESPAVRDLAAKLGAKLGFSDSVELQAVFAAASKDALDSNRPVADRRRAVQVLANAPYAKLAPAATALLGARQPPALQQAAIEALGDSDDPRVGAALLGTWQGFTPKMRVLAIQTIFARENRLPALLDALQSRAVRRGDISAIQREQLTKSRNQRIAARARKLFANPAAGAELQRRIDRYQKALTGRRDPERGRQVFAKTCLACHKLKDEGHEVGPALGSVVNKPDEAILLDLLDPSGHIESEYAGYIVQTRQGLSFTGILVSESATSVTLRKEKGVNESILRKDIETIKASDVSLMPSNLHEQFNPQDAADLIAFLRKAFGSKTSAQD